MHYSYYDPTTIQLSPNGPGQTASIVPDHSANPDPRFVNAAAGDFQLLASSPAIDAGDPAPLVSGESATDLAGKPRVVAGHNGRCGGQRRRRVRVPAPRSDGDGAAGAASARTGARITFSAVGSDPSPGDSVSYRWTFDDGAQRHRRERRPRVREARPAHGDGHGDRPRRVHRDRDEHRYRHRAEPHLTGLKLKPRSFKRGHAATIGYRDSAAATTTLTIEHRKGRRWVKVLALKHHDRTGADKVKLKSGRLKAGAYRVVAVARDAGGTSNRVTARFTVKG